MLALRFDFLAAIVSTEQAHLVDEAVHLLKMWAALQSKTALLTLDSAALYRGLLRGLSSLRCLAAFPMRDECDDKRGKHIHSHMAP